MGATETEQERQTDTVTVPREWLEKVLAGLQQLDLRTISIQEELSELSRWRREFESFYRKVRVAVKAASKVF